MKTTRRNCLIILFGLLLSACGGGSSLSRVDQGTIDGVLHFGNGTEPLSYFRLQMHRSTGALKRASSCIGAYACSECCRLVSSG